MEAHDLVTGTRWELLKALCEPNQMGADLARLTNTTPANVAQHLKLLELAGLVSRVRLNGKSMSYRVKEDMALLTVLGEQSYRAVVPLDSLGAVELRLFCEQTPSAKLLRRFLLDYEELVASFQSFGVVRADNDIQLLVLAPDVKQLRKEYANIQLGDVKIIIWSHTPQEFSEGIARSEPYFLDMIRNLTIYYDPTNLLKTWKEAHK